MPTTENEVHTLEIADLRTDGGTQPRAYLDGPTVMEYADAMERGVQLPPVNAMYDGTDYWLYDGFHRVKAAQNIDRTTIRVDVQQGTKQDAQWESLAANKKHGLRRTQSDKQRAIKRALKGWGQKKSNNAIAKHIGCSDTTVAKYRTELEATSQIGKSDKREGADGRTIDTSNIGSTSKKKGTRPDPPEPKPMQVRSGSRRRRRERRQKDAEADTTWEPKRREQPPEDPPPTSEDVAQGIREELVKMRGSQAVSMLRDFVDEQHQFSAEERKGVQEAAERIGWLILEVSEEIKAG